MENDPPYPKARLSELLAAVESPSAAVGGGHDAPATLVEELRESAVAHFAELPMSAQVEILGCLTTAEQDDLLEGLPVQVSQHLRQVISPGIGMEI